MCADKARTSSGQTYCVLLQVLNLSAFTALRHLELSYNAIRSLAPLATCGAAHLEELYAASNKISEVGISSNMQRLWGVAEPQPAASHLWGPCLAQGM